MLVWALLGRFGLIHGLASARAATDTVHNRTRPPPTASPNSPGRTQATRGVVWHATGTENLNSYEAGADLRELWSG